MLMKIASCAALTLCALTANAADQAYEWSFQGFTSYGSPFYPDKKITGQFVVNDLNQDGLFDLGELKSFTFDRAGTEPCLSEGNTTCGLSNFSYNPQGELSFAYNYREASGSWGTRHWIQTGYEWGTVRWYGEDGEDEVYRWDARTVTTVTAVPEPHSYLMLGAGLLSVAAFTRRRKRK